MGWHCYGALGLSIILCKCTLKMLDYRPYQGFPVQSPVPPDTTGKDLCQKSWRGDACHCVDPTEPDGLIHGKPFYFVLKCSLNF